MAPKLAPRDQHGFVVPVFVSAFAWQAWRSSHRIFFADRCGTLATWPSSWPQGVQHGFQVGIQVMAGGPASLQVGLLRCNMAPAVGSEIPTMAPESAPRGPI